MNITVERGADKNVLRATRTRRFVGRWARCQRRFCGKCRIRTGRSGYHGTGQRVRRLTCDDCGAFWSPAGPPGWTNQRVRGSLALFYCEVCSAKRGIDLVIEAEREKA
jgi:hypothetical protein